MTSTDYSPSEYVGKITVTEDIPREIVDDLLTTALDGGYGGSWYWIQGFRAHWRGDPEDRPTYFHDYITRGSTFSIIPEEDGTEYFLDLPKYLHGLEQACKKLGLTAQALYDDHDAITADIVLQYALFGDIVYG